MRIAFVSTVRGHEWPGSEYLWAETAARLLESGHDVFVRCSEDFVTSENLHLLITKGITVDLFARQDRLSRLKDKFLNPLSRLRNWRPDLIIISSGSAFDIAYHPSLVKLLLSTSIPFLPICHFNAETFWINPGDRDIMRSIYAKAKHTVFVSEDNCRITERQLALKIPSYSVIRPPFPVQIEEPLAWPDLIDNCWKFVCVARLESRWKGQDVLFEVLAKPVWKERNWSLDLYGSGAEEGYLRDLSVHYGIQDRVSFKGFSKDRLEIWRQSHIQIFPTRGEGGPMVLTEGMLCGRIAVITDCGNAGEYIDDGVDGFLSEYPTASIFSRSLEAAWSQRGVWQSMGILASRKIRTIMKGHRPVDILIELIHKLLR